MTVVLELKPEIEEALQKKAAAKGSPFREYIEGVLQKHVDIGSTLDEILAPVRKNFADSGMTEEELNELIDRERQALWDEKHNGRGKG